MLVYKPVGKNCAQLIRELQEQQHYRKICYAGRLDIMAHGLVKILINEEVKSMASYNETDKIYKFKVLIGFSTDSTDPLGLITDYNQNYIPDLAKIINAFLAICGTQQQNYHIYSSKPCPSKIDGKSHPLWYYTSQNRLNEVDIPSKQITIYDMQHINTEQEHFNYIKQEILSKLNAVFNNGHLEYRTCDIIKQWSTLNIDNEYYILTFKCTVSSGTYIRQIVQDISQQLDINMLAYDIERLHYI